MSARDDYPIGRTDVLYSIDPGTWKDMCDEIDRLRASAALGAEIEWEIERYSDPYLMGVRARVEAGDGFTQAEVSP